MRAIVLVGPESPEPAAGATLLRLAAHAQSDGLAALVVAGFLGASPKLPSLEAAIIRVHRAGARTIILVPYAIGDEVGDSALLDAAAQSARTSDPTLRVIIAPTIGNHPALAAVADQRAMEARYLAAHPDLRRHRHPSDTRSHDPDAWLQIPSALILVTPMLADPTNDDILLGIAQHIHARGRFTRVEVCAVGADLCELHTSIDRFVADGDRNIIVLPYVLQSMAESVAVLLAALEAARERHPVSTIILSEHLAYDRRLLDAIADRVAQALSR